MIVLFVTESEHPVAVAIYLARCGGSGEGENVITTASSFVTDSAHPVAVEIYLARCGGSGEVENVTAIPSANNFIFGWKLCTVNQNAPNIS
ncbi:hypothetical protein J6590_087158 [Homalodisca vitripennis]|nr:hypothetical protein J6590_087158 [Homalodisca vitripennis]